MVRRYIKTLNIIFLFTFFSFILLINFLHTEKTINDTSACPACHFQNSTLTTNQINFFHLPQLQLISQLKCFEASPSYQILLITPSSRSPPQI